MCIAFTHSPSHTGSCSAIDLAWCKGVYCEDNQHLNCKVSNYKCVCPTCEDADPAWCLRTKCLEQPMKLGCKLDVYTKKCRCPRCSDQNDPIWCRKAFCGSSNNIRCR